MRKTKILFIALLFSLFCLSSCNPVSYIQTETLEPAEVAIPPKIQSAILLLKHPENEIDLLDDDTFNQKLHEEIKYGIADVLANSPRFNSNNIVIPDYQEVKEYLEKDTLQWLDMKRITDKYDVDAVILLDDFRLNSSLENKHVIEQGSFYYYVAFRINARGNWIFYYPYSKQTIDRHNYSEKFVWEAYDYSKQMAVDRLPDYEKTFREAAYFTGYDYAKRILPTWMKTSRSYYSSGTDVLKKAAAQVDSSNWQKAIEIWKENLKHTDAEVVSRAAYNIAFAFEMQGKIELALQWARKSYDVKPKERTKKYIEILKKRKELVSRLQEQIK